MDRQLTPRLSFEDLRNGSGTDLGASRWVTVDQARIDLFAAVSEDHQWIHVDPEQSANGPFGGTIAHGYLTITLIGSLLGELLRVDENLVLINYGLDRLRFLSPVPSGSRIRALATIEDVQETDHGLRLTVDVNSEIQGDTAKPCFARAVVLVRRTE